MDKYFFACFGYDYAKNVISTLNLLRKRKYLFYYDDGMNNIDISDLDNIIKDAHFVLLFIDKDYLSINNIVNCINVSKKYNKDIVLVNISEDTIEFDYKYKYLFNDHNCYTLMYEFGVIDIFKDVCYAVENEFDITKALELLKNNVKTKNIDIDNNYYRLDLTNSRDVYFHGLDLYNDKRYDEAFKFIEKSAMMNNPSAINLLSLCYQTNRGIENDYEKADNLLYETKELGDYNALYKYALQKSRIYNKNCNYNEAIDILKNLAMNGYKEACYKLGYTYKTGDFSVIDYKEAYKWFKRGAFMGFADSKYELALCYLDGIGVKKDVLEGMKWLKDAAHTGSKDACYELSLKYKYSFYGYEVNDVLAFHYCLMAAQMGHLKAEYDMYYYYSKGIGVKADEVEARKWMWYCACDGDDYAREIVDFPDRSDEKLINKRYYEYVFEKKQ